MKVKDVMTETVTCCGPDTNLAEAAALMWKADCGALPIIENGKLAGILTDRDICIALGTRNRPAAEIAAKEAATPFVHTCAPDSDVHAAMTTMREARVRRLPVVDAEGNLCGILSLNDLALAADRKKSPTQYDAVMTTMKAICAHPHGLVVAA